MRIRLGQFISPYKLILPLCFGVFIAADDQTVVVTLLPEMMADLRVGVSELDRASWSITGYLIGYTAAMPLMGRISDRAGYRRAFLLAMTVFSIGSVLVAVSPEIPGWLYGGDPEYNWLIGTRIFQAIGGGAVIPITIAAAGELVDGKHRAIAYGLVGASAEAGAVFGPIWGGGIGTWLSWEWAFWLNIPLTIAASIWIMKNPPGRRTNVRVDIPTGLIFAAALTLLTVGLVRLGHPDTLMAISLTLTIGLVLLLLFMNNRSRDALFPQNLFKLLSFNLANVTHFLIGAALIIGMVTVPLLAATVLGKSPLEGGLQLLRMTVAIGFGALIGGYITQRIGERSPVIIGTIITGIGFLLMSEWTLNIAEPMLTIHLAITGLGLGLVISPITETALRKVNSGQRGIASALLSSSRMIGMISGLAVMTALGTAQFHELLADIPAFSIDPNVQQHIADSAVDAGMKVFTRFYQYGAVICFLTLIPAWTMTKKRRNQLTDES